MADQAQYLRKFLAENRKQARVLAVTSGKGGVGKTCTSVNLAIALAMHKPRVVVLDADLGLANVEVLLGLNSLYNLQHVVYGERTMQDILVTGPGNIRVVPGNSGLGKLADMNEVGRERVLAGIRELQEQNDFIIIDTMAGIGRNAVNFAAAADETLLVVTPEPASIVDGYATLKAVFNRREDAVARLIVNQAGTPQQAKAVAKKLMHVTQQHMGRKLSYLGHVPRDPHVSQSAMQSVPYVLRFPAAPSTKAMEELAVRVLHQRADTDVNRPTFWKRLGQTLGIASSA